MKEIGGYIELGEFHGKMLYDNGIKLNCGRNAFAYIIKAKGIRKILMPKFMCSSNDKVLRDNHVSVRFYSVGLDFKPVGINREYDEYLYLVNYYGQLSNEYILSLGTNIIVDNAQAYFNEPLKGTDTIYTCRKYFGVSDGAILYTDVKLNEKLPIDESFERMHFLLGRYERCASEFYNEYVDNNKLFNNEPIKRMSKLTENLLHGVDYNKTIEKRNENFNALSDAFTSVNKLDLTAPEGAFMYPLYIDNGESIRKQLQKKKIYIPTLWPSVYDRANETDLEYDMAKNILPLPVDQRYNIDDMKYIAKEVKKCIS